MKKEKIIVSVVLAILTVLSILFLNSFRGKVDQKILRGMEEEYGVDSKEDEEPESTTQTDIQSDTEEYVEEDTSQEKLIEATIKEFMQKESKVAEDGEKAAQCYIRFLKNNYEQKYDVIDIDEDGISELLTLNEGSSAAMYRYDSKKDKVKELHSYQLGKASTMYYSKEKHQVVFITGDTGGGEFDTYKYVDGELKKIETLIWHNGKFEEEGYTYNGEKISIEEGDEYLEVMKEQYQSLRGEM